MADNPLSDAALRRHLRHPAAQYLLTLDPADRQAAHDRLQRVAVVLKSDTSANVWAFPWHLRGPGGKGAIIEAIPYLPKLLGSRWAGQAEAIIADVCAVARAAARLGEPGFEQDVIEALPAGADQDS